MSQPAVGHGPNAAANANPAPSGPAGAARAAADLSQDVLRRLHREEIADPTAIRRILGRALDQRVVLDGGINRLTDRRRARIAAIEDDLVRLNATDFGNPPPPRLLLRFELEATGYLLVAEVRAASGADIEIALPRVLYRSERRDVGRRDLGTTGAVGWQVEIAGPDASLQSVEVTDYSRNGLGVKLDATATWPVETPLHVRFLAGPRAGEETDAVLRHREAAEQPEGWQRIGLSLGRPAPKQLLPVEKSDHLFRPRALDRLRDSLHRIASPRAASEATSRRVEFRDDRGERIRGILDSVGDPEHAPLVLIPPAWGRTKETLLPLALTIVESFRRAGASVSVFRYDGIRRRGESHNDPECVAPGDEYLHFTVSQAIHDLHAVLDHAERELRPSRVALVTSSISAVEGRRGIASDPKQRVDGWVSLVGVADLRSSLREFSGGVDFGLGILAGVEFGVQDLLGVPCDLDRLGRDALENDLWFPEDARKDMEAIDIPICWIHGRHDGWMQIAGDRQLLSWGDTSQRRLIEIPTGHQLRTSEEAMTAFRLVASEVGRILTGARVRGTSPNDGTLAERQRGERRHLPAATFDLRRFWRDYLVGRRDDVGIEFLTATSAYQELMAEQVRMLGLRGGERVADLGCGAGDFPCHLQDDASSQQPLSIDAYDFVPDALARMRKRLDRGARPLAVNPVVANLSTQANAFGLPCRDGRYDAVLASLLISYLDDPAAFLAEVHRILEPGGRLVLSSIRRDGDLSKIYADALAELHPALLRDRFGEEVASEIEAIRQTFLSDAARILDLEEFGYFRFWDADELTRLVEGAGFGDVRTTESLGRPPQAIVLTAVRSAP